jgi:hypothetical protein
MAVLYGASCSFLTPYGYQTNLMVMSPGRYTLRDFVRAGTPVATAEVGTDICRSGAGRRRSDHGRDDGRTRACAHR